MIQSITNDIGIQELTVDEIDDVSGGIICILCLAFGAGYAVGTALYNAATR